MDARLHVEAMDLRAAARIGIISLALAGMTYLVASFLPKEYASHQSYYFPGGQGGGSSGALQFLQSGGDKDSGVIPSFKSALSSPLVGSGAQTVTGILTSRTCLDEVVRKLALDREWDMSPSKAVRELEGRIKVRTEKSGFLRVEVSGESPALCVRILKAMDDHLARRSKELTINVARRNREIVEKRAALAQTEIERLRSRLTTDPKLSPVADVAAISKVYWETKQKLDEARTQSVKANALIAAVEDGLRKLVRDARQGKGNIAAIQSAGPGGMAEGMKVMDELAKKLQDSRIALREADSKFRRESAEYRDVARSTRVVEDYANEVLKNEEAQIDAGIAPQLAEAKAEYASLQAAVRENEANLSRFERTLQGIPDKYARWEDAKAEFEVALEKRGLLEAELELVRLAEARDPSRYEIVDGAYENPDPVGPRKMLFAGVAFVLALAAQLGPVVAKKVRESESR